MTGFPQTNLLSVIANWSVAAAYFFITYLLHANRKRGVWPFTETVTFKAFIFMCGVHHMVMPLGNMSLTLGVDVGLALVSVGCAFAIWSDSRASL